MPKVNLLARESTTNSLTMKRKRLQMLKAKQQIQKQTFDDESPLAFNDFRIVNHSSLKYIYNSN